MLHRGSLKGKVERKGRTLAEDRRYLDFSAQELGNLLRYGEAKPRTAIGSAVACIYLLKCAKDPVQHIAGDAYAGIGYVNRETGIVF